MESICSGACARPLSGKSPIDFQPITLEDAPKIAHMLEKQPFRTCDYTIGAIFQWRNYFNTYFAIRNGLLLQKANYPGECDCYAFPVGEGDMDEALSAIEADAAFRGIPLTFCCVPEEGLPILTARYGDRAQVDSHRDWADYLYNAEDLKTFPGKRYHGQKNHLNRFKRENPNYRYVPVTEENYIIARDFLRDYKKYVPLTKVIQQEEMVRSQELLRDAIPLGQTAGYIESDGVVVALSVGEVVQDTLYVHVEKARLDYPGAYQTIVSEFAKAACKEDTRFINREDDSGEEGLRTSKLAYKPIALLPKYWVGVL